MKFTNRPNRPFTLTAALLGLLARSGAMPADDWPQFRGPNRDGISRETGLLRQWPDGGPKVLWSSEVCDGYAAPAVVGGRVYFEDYDKETSDWLVRCLTLEEGKELWRFKENKKIRPNHGITRTVPAADGKYVFSLDPKCVLHCLDAGKGAEIWRQNFVSDYESQIPPWYAGQCPLIEPDRIIVAPGGKALLAALDKATGKPIWLTPNPRSWPASHASVVPAEIGGVKQYLHATLNGVFGAAAADGKELWRFDRKFNMAMVPSPLLVKGDRIFLTNQYNSGTTMIRVQRSGVSFTAAEVFTVLEGGWSSEIQTPICYGDRIFAVGKEKRGLFTCIDVGRDQLEIAWTSLGKASFGLGSYILADGLFFILDGDKGTLRLLEASAAEYRELDSAQILQGHDVWAPPALSEGKLIIRDWNRMVCLQVGPSKAARPKP